MKKTKSGFTIVELLIVIVVIAILATISIVAYRGVQGRARDSQRVADIKTITKALELYYIDNGSYPSGVCTPSCPSPKKINGSWATTSDGSWSVLESALVPKYVSSLPKDPAWSINTSSGMEGGGNYDYYRTSAGDWCNVANNQGYILTYSLETMPRQTAVVGDCSSGGSPGYSSSWYFFKH